MMSCCQIYDLGGKCEIKGQVSFKGERSEKLRVNKEIQELRKELASLDSPQTTARASNVTIKDTWKMDS